MSDQQLIVIGASARAACFSAHRSAYLPYWIDQFGDHDLDEKFQGTAVPADQYPAAILDLIHAAPMAPFVYTGAMENHLQVLEQLEGLRPLLGNGAGICRQVRDPQRLAACWQRAGIHHPQLATCLQAEGVKSGDYLIKPVQGAGGQGVRVYRDNDTDPLPTRVYLQEFIEGESRAGVYLGDGSSAVLLGVTRQLTGESFLNAARFAYCGSIGPLLLEERETEQWSAIGNSLTAEFALRGLFGVDAVKHAGDIYPVEVNPRYTASVEVLELASGLPVMNLHCRACAASLPELSPSAANKMLAKAYMFAGQELRSPPKVSDIYNASDALPTSADIPAPGSLISPGHPLMTLIARVSSEHEAMATLKARAKLLYNSFEVV